MGYWNTISLLRYNYRHIASMYSPFRDSYFTCVKTGYRPFFSFYGNFSPEGGVAASSLPHVFRGRLPITSFSIPPLRISS